MKRLSRKVIPFLAVFAFGCIEPTPPGSDVDAGTSSDTGVGADADAPGVGLYGEPCEETACTEDFVCQNQAGSEVCTRRCDDPGDCERGTCAAGWCWPEQETCGAGGVPDLGQCSYDVSCQGLIEGDPSLTTGHYAIDPGAGPITAWCDFDAVRGAGFTMYRVDSGALRDDPAAYVDACESAGLAPIVPRNRAHMNAIRSYFGALPTLVGVELNQGTGLSDATGNCATRSCDFFLGESDLGTCGRETQLVPDTPGLLRRASGNCEFGVWSNTGPVDFPGTAFCAANDAVMPTPRNCQNVFGLGLTANKSRQGVDGVYTIRPRPTSVEFDAHCRFEEPFGWTLAAKIDGRDPEFRYDADFWTTEMAINPGSPGMERSIARLQTWTDVPASRLLLAMESTADVGQLNNLRPENQLELEIPLSAPITLRQLFLNDEPLRVSGVRLTSWQSLIDGSTLQSVCNVGGFNLSSDGAANHSVRIGVLGDEEEGDASLPLRCRRPDSSLGVGILGTAGVPEDVTITAGNAGIDSLNLPVWALIYVR